MELYENIPNVSWFGLLRYVQQNSGSDEEALSLTPGLQDLGRSLLPHCKKNDQMCAKI